MTPTYWGKVDGTEIQTKKRPDESFRCFVIVDRLKEAVCRECLALHSKWLAVRTYYLAYVSKVSSAELCAFPSEYDYSAISSNCEEIFCRGIFAWDSKSCETIDTIFPHHHDLLKNGEKKHSSISYEEHSVDPDYQGIDRKMMSDVFCHLAMKRMAVAPSPNI